MTRSPMVTNDSRNNENWKKAETKSKFLENSLKTNFYMVLLFSQEQIQHYECKTFFKKFEI